MLGSGVPYLATLMRLDVAPSIVPPAVLSILPSILRSSALNRALGILGDGWTLLVLREAFLGVSAFERLRERLAIPRQTLANRLRALVADDILELRGREYKLTAKGLDLYPHSLLMWRWERHWDGASAPALPSRLMHRPCGAATIPTLACRHCAAPVQLCDVAYRPGPGAGHDLPAARAHRLTRAAQVRGVAGHNDRSSSVYIVADRWAHLTLGAVFLGQQTFDAIRSSTGAATNILAGRLEELVRGQFLKKRRSSADARRYEYRLTDRARDIFPITLALMRWADRWMPNPHGPAMRRTHTCCGRSLDAIVVCSACGDSLRPRDVEIGGRSARRAPAVAEATT